MKPKTSRHDESEEIEYEPTSVKDLLTEMKDLSELIVDLAYSAVAFDNEDIAAEVHELEDTMDTLNYKVRLVAMLAARTTEDAEQLTGILQVAAATEAVSNAAGDIASLLKTVETRPFFPRVLARAEEKLKQFRVPESSPLAGQTVDHIEDESSMRILAIRRGSRWLYVPEEDQLVMAKDSLVLRGTDEGFETVREMAGLPPRPPPSRDLVKDEDTHPAAARFEDLLLEMKDTSELMVDLAFSAVLYNSHEIAEEVEELEETMDELRETAQLAALEALVAGAWFDPKRALGAVRLTEAAEQIADSALDIADVVLREVEPHPILELAIRESDVVISRVTVEPGSILDGKTVGEAHVAAETGMWIIALKHGGRYTYGVTKKTPLVAGDVLIARGPIDGEEELMRLVLGPDEESDADDS